MGRGLTERDARLLVVARRRRALRTGPREGRGAGARATRWGAHPRAPTWRAARTRSKAPRPWTTRRWRRSRPHPCTGRSPVLVRLAAPGRRARRRHRGGAPRVPCRPATRHHPGRRPRQACPRALPAPASDGTGARCAGRRRALPRLDPRSSAGVRPGHVTGHARRPLHALPCSTSTWAIGSPTRSSRAARQRHRPDGTRAVERDGLRIALLRDASHGGTTTSPCSNEAGGRA